MKRMKKINNLILVLVLLCNILFPVISIAAEYTVTITFNDENLYNAILETLVDKIESSTDDTYTITMTQSNLESVTTLFLNGKGITDITGLDSLTNLVNLDLNTNEITDITALSSLTNLKYLSLENNSIKDITLLSELVTLTDLRLADTEIKDISTLSELTNLTLLSLRNNEIENIEPLSGLTNLEKLYLENNSVEDITSLSGLTNLTDLRLSNNEISNIDILEEMNIEYLNIAGQTIRTTINEEETIVELPNIFISAKQEGSIAYTDKEWNFINCTLSEDGKSIIIDENVSFAEVNIGGNSTELYPIETAADYATFKIQVGDVINIGTAAELFEFAERVNLGEDYSGKTIKLKNDIDLGCTETNQWTPIGKSDEYKFKGTFDGCGFTISGMYISSNEDAYNGLFGYIEEATISNITIEGTITANTRYVGSIVAYCSKSSIKNCISNVTISCIEETGSTWGMQIGGIVGLNKQQSVISNCINNGQIYCESSGVLSRVGGISGYNWSGTIKKSVNKGNIETKGVYYTGGIIGEVYYQYSKIEKCYNSGDIKLNSVPQGAGGIAGMANVGEFDSCYNTGDIEYIGSTTSNGTATIYKIGGITGITHNNVTIINCYNTGDTATGGGIVGVISSDERQIIENNYYLEGKSDYGYYSSGIEEVEIVEKTSTEMKSEDFVTQLNNNVDCYRLDSNSYNEGYPILTWASDIEIMQEPTKLSYRQNKDELDLSGGKVKLLYNYNEYDTVIDMSDENITVEGFDNTEEKEITLTVKYDGEFEDYFDVTIVEGVPPILSVEYSTTMSTNQDVVATITANEEIQEVEGWTLSDDKMKLTKTYTANGEDTVEVFDIVGNSSTIEVKVNNIDKEAPELSANYKPKEITNKDVEVTITANEKVQQVEGWTLSDDKTKLTKTYTVNGQETVDVYDIAGNKSSIQIKVENIDKTAIELEVEYSTTQMTNQNVTVTVTANKEIQEVNGWTLSEDKTKLTKIYTENGEEELIVYALAGNSKSTKIEVNNIDKKAPTANVSYSITEITNQNVEVTITVNEEIQEVEGWILSEDEKTLTKTYTINKQEEITISDIAGNTLKIQVEVDNIDKLAPELKVSYSSDTTNKIVTVTITANEEIQEVEGWKLSEDKTTLTRVYSENKKEVVKVYDLAGNVTNKTVEVTNIQEDDTGKDDTTVPADIPQTGENVLIVIGIIGVLSLAIALGIRFRAFKDIK